MKTAMTETPATPKPAALEGAELLEGEDGGGGGGDVVVPPGVGGVGVPEAVTLTNNF